MIIPPPTDADPPSSAPLPAAPSPADTSDRESPPASPARRPQPPSSAPPRTTRAHTRAHSTSNPPTPSSVPVPSRKKSKATTLDDDASKASAADNLELAPAPIARDPPPPGSPLADAQAAYTQLSQLITQASGVAQAITATRASSTTAETIRAEQVSRNLTDVISMIKTWIQDSIAPLNATLTQGQN